MAIPNLLIASIFQSTVQVAELVGGSTINQIGANVVADADDTNTNLRKQVVNFAIEYRGKVYVCFQRDIAPFNYVDVWSYDGVSWSNEFNEFSRIRPFGLFIVNTGSVQRLFAIYLNAANGGQEMYIRSTDDGSTWAAEVDSGLSFGFSSQDDRRGKTILFNNKLYWLSANGATPTCYEVDPISGAGTSIPVAWDINSASSTDNACFVVYDDRLFCFHVIGNLSLATDYGLYEFTGGGWSLNTTVTSDSRIGSGFQNMSEGACCAFTDPTTGDLIVIANGWGSSGPSSDAGSTAFRLTPSGSAFTPVEITNTVIPAGFRPGVRGSGQTPSEDRWYVFFNNDAPGTGEVYFFFAQGAAPGTGYTVLQWNGVGSVMTTVAAGPSTIYAVPEAAFGGGDRIYRGVGNQCVIESAVAVLGGYEISYRVYGLQASQNVTLWYSLGQEAPDTQATINAQTGGSGITGGNTVTGITGDDGATLFTLRWDLNADAVPSGDAAHILLDINP